MRRIGTRRWITLEVCSAVLGLFGPGGFASGQDTPSERGHGLTAEEAAAGWISLFDGSTTFGWSGAQCQRGRLVGGTNSGEFGDCELRAHDPDTDLAFGRIAISPLGQADGVARPIKELILPGESFVVSGRPAFILTPPKDRWHNPRPWILYAPTLPGLPDAHEKWMHEQFLAAGAWAGAQLLGRVLPLLGAGAFRHRACADRRRG